MMIMIFWKSPEVINEEQLKWTKDMIDKWLILIDKIRENLLQNFTIIENNKDHANQRHIILSELSMARFFTFSSISALISNAHYSDAFTLLRVLYKDTYIYGICGIVMTKSFKNT